MVLILWMMTMMMTMSGKRRRSVSLWYTQCLDRDIDWCLEWLPNLSEMCTVQLSKRHWGRDTSHTCAAGSFEIISQLLKMSKTRLCRKHREWYIVSDKLSACTHRKCCRTCSGSCKISIFISCGTTAAIRFGSGANIIFFAVSSYCVNAARQVVGASI